MSIKKKLILIGICAVIIIVVFTVNVIRKVKDDNQGEIKEEVATVTSISRAEAYRLLSYLEYDKAEREEIPMGIIYAEDTMSGWYDTYINAVWKMGLIEQNVTISPEKPLTYGICKELADKLIIKKPELQTVYQGLSFNFTDADKEMPIEEFLDLYEAILVAAPEEASNWKRETLLVLGREVTEDGKDRMVTDRGRYYYLDAQSYEDYLGQDTAEDSSTVAVTPEVMVESDADVSEASVPSASIKNETSLIDQYMDMGINVLTCGQEIIYVSSVFTDKIVVHNVWIKQGTDDLVDTFINGIDKSFTALYKLSTNLEKVVGDITVENQKIVQISVKPDMIQGKVLRSGEDFIEIEGYGKVLLEEDYRIYKIYGTLSMEPTGSILVGYENTDFIVSEGKISAALITESIKAENIRVLLRMTDYKDIYHKKVEITSTDDFTVKSGDTSKSYKAGETVSIAEGDEQLEAGRLIIKTVSEEGKLEVLSIERSNGNPKYRGSIEIAEDENGLLIVNELPLEEYLYAVLPSEMPTSYGAEALKVQALCARSYAYKHLMSNSLGEYGAHVDDSVSYQVYNNIAENEDSILAVKDTYGKVIEYDGEVINAYYFSTSCGHTAKASSAWANDIDFPYLGGKLLLLTEEGDDTEVQSEALEAYSDLSSEEGFRSFLEAEDITTYDSGFSWYRWNATMSVKDIKQVIDATLSDRYRANPEMILTKTGETEDGVGVFESIPVDTVGTVVDIKVLERESSGMIAEILITGSKNIIKVRKEYNIRALLAPVYDKLTRQDESEIENLRLLPSAFFIIDKNEKQDELSSITVTGGGYGHGVGLSQNGVKALADSGKGYEDIITYFYDDTQMGFIYE